MFANGWGASILSGERFYCDKLRPYELAIITTEDKPKTTTFDLSDIYWELDYSHTEEDSHNMGGVLGYLTEDEVNKWLDKIEKYK